MPPDLVLTVVLVAPEVIEVFIVAPFCFSGALPRHCLDPRAGLQVLNHHLVILVPFRVHRIHQLLVRGRGLHSANFEIREAFRLDVLVQDHFLGTSSGRAPAMHFVGLALLRLGVVQVIAVGVRVVLIGLLQMPLHFFVQLLLERLQAFGHGRRVVVLGIQMSNHLRIGAVVIPHPIVHIFGLNRRVHWFWPAVLTIHMSKLQRVGLLGGDGRGDAAGGHHVQTGGRSCGTTTSGCLTVFPSDGSHRHKAGPVPQRAWVRRL
mmetsp:Transcript_8006/g.15536  ORF Transcript_8006/g.15536 Transcript_8006/m.15536 type:complete len:262 (-) Transcript_8006:131-916(-)